MQDFLSGYVSATATTSIVLFHPTEAVGKDDFNLPGTKRFSLF